jgi:hypothetical protein
VSLDLDRRHVHDGRVLRALLGSALLVALPLIAAAMDGGGYPIVASCADGSVIFATKWEEVRCAGAIRVPRSHGTRVGSMPGRSVALALEREAARERDLEEQIAQWVVQRRAVLARSLAFTPREHSNLRQLIASRPAPAAAVIEYERRVGAPARMRVAHAVRFETHLRHVFERLGMSLAGPALVFEADGFSFRSAPVPFFAQGGITFRPDAGDPRQLGWISEEVAGAGPAASRLGYVVLPSGFDVNRPVVIFWGDAVVATQPFSTHGA